MFKLHVPYEASFTSRSLLDSVHRATHTPLLIYNSDSGNTWISKKLLVLKYYVRLRVKTRSCSPLSALISIVKQRDSVY